MQERYETEKTLLQREMEEMNALLEERQSLLETKEDLMERRDSESPLKDDFCYYLKNVKEQPTSKDWDKLCRFDKSKLPKLYVMLRNYNVSEREMRICPVFRAPLPQILNYPKNQAVVFRKVGKVSDPC
jgi:hypothetical protein